MAPDTFLEAGMIVQLDPRSCQNPMFAGCMMTITEPKAWGAQGYVQMTGENGAPGGQAHYRASWAEMEDTGGMAVWIVP